MLSLVHVAMGIGFCQVASAHTESHMLLTTNNTHTGSIGGLDHCTLAWPSHSSLDIHTVAQGYGSHSDNLLPWLSMPVSLCTSKHQNISNIVGPCFSLAAADALIKFFK